MSVVVRTAAPAAAPSASGRGHPSPPTAERGSGVLARCPRTRWRLWDPERASRPLRAGGPL